MNMKESNRSEYNRSINKWIALNMMQQAEQVRCTAEMLAASMEDLFDEMENLNTILESLSEATETIMERMEEMMDILNSEMDPDPPIPPVTDAEENSELPF
jgi:histidinol dehydrogenase